MPLCTSCLRPLMCLETLLVLRYSIRTEKYIIFWLCLLKLDAFVMFFRVHGYASWLFLSHPFFSISKIDKLCISHIIFLMSPLFSFILKATFISKHRDSVLGYCSVCHGFVLMSFMSRLLSLTKMTRQNPKNKKPSKSYQYIQQTGRCLNSDVVLT